MIAIISPAKNLDFSIDVPAISTTAPQFASSANELMTYLKKLSRKKISTLMDISDKLSDLNYDRYQNWSDNPSSTMARPAAYVFRGDVYRGLDMDTISADRLSFLQKHIRILSGLYGILRPLDNIQPYRLEMGSALKTKKGKNLYAFWGNQVLDELNTLLQEDDGILINLASNEYVKVLNGGEIAGRVITPVFKDKAKDGSYKVKFAYAKKARGQMCRFMVDHHIDQPESLKGFNTEGYAYNEQLSSENEWTFTRD